MKKIHHILDYTCVIISLLITSLALFTQRFGWSLYLERLSHFQAQYFGITLVLGLGLLLSGRFRSLLIILCCSAMLSAQILPWYVASNYINNSPGNYRLLVSNVNRGQFDEAPTLAVVNAEQPDLVLLIEVNKTMTEEFSALSKTLPYRAEEAITENFYLMLFSKYPLTHVQVVQFGNKNNKQSLLATVEVNGQSLSLVATHPSSPSNRTMFTARNTLFADVTDYINDQTDPVLLIGDFNTTMWSPYYQRLIRRTHLKNARKGFGIKPTWPRIASRYNLPAWTTVLFAPFQIPLDHCLVAPDIRVAGMHIAADTGSDHAPIVADLVVP